MPSGAFSDGPTTLHGVDDRPANGSPGSSMAGGQRTGQIRARPGTGRAVMVRREMMASWWVTARMAAARSKLAPIMAYRGASSPLSAYSDGRLVTKKLRHLA